MNTIDWQHIAKQEAQDLVNEMSGFGIYDFQIYLQKQESRIHVLLDKFTDKYGSANVQDCQRFSKDYSNRLQMLSMERKIPENYSLEVSSAGAEREICFPQDIDRFRSIPMKVQFLGENKKLVYKVLSFIEKKEEMSYWQEVQTRQERKKSLGKKKKKAKLIAIKEDEIQKIHLFLDF